MKIEPLKDEFWKKYEQKKRAFIVKVPKWGNRKLNYLELERVWFALRELEDLTFGNGNDTAWKHVNAAILELMKTADRNALFRRILIFNGIINEENSKETP